MDTLPCLLLKLRMKPSDSLPASSEELDQCWFSYTDSMYGSDVHARKTVRVAEEREIVRHIQYL